MNKHTQDLISSEAGTQRDLRKTRIVEQLAANGFDINDQIGLIFDAIVFIFGVAGLPDSELPEELREYFKLRRQVKDQNKPT